MLEIRDVSIHVDASLALGSIDVPHAGWRGAGYALDLRGWALGLGGRCRHVEAWSSGRWLATAEVDGPRPDIAVIPSLAEVENAPTCGYAIGVGLLGLPADFELELRLVFADGRRFPLGTVTGRRTPLAGPTGGSLLPLMVTCLGRTGTTLLMERLGRHPTVVIEPRHPHETRLATYWAHLLKTLGDPGPSVPPATWFTRFEDLDRVFPVPFADFMDDEQQQWLTDDYVESMASFVRANLETFYRRIARRGERPDARYFAEKQFPGVTADVLDELYPGRCELISVRDPRDLVISMVAFLAGGHTVMGHRASDPPDVLTTQLTEQLRALVDRRDRMGERAHVVRYEEMVDQPERTLTALLDHCGLPASEADVRRMMHETPTDLAAFEGHRTAPSLAGSLARWRDEPRGEWTRYWSPDLEALTLALGYPATADPDT